MISTKLKTHYYEKKIRKAKSRGSSYLNSSGKAGIFIDAERLGDSSGLLKLREAVSGLTEDLEIVICGTEFEIPKGLEYKILDSSKVSLKGEFRDENIQKIAEGNFDFLICNLSERNLTGFLLAAICNSPLKIGSSPDPYGIFDVEINTGKQEVFQEESLKYLEILKKKK